MKFKSTAWVLAMLCVRIVFLQPALAQEDQQGVSDVFKFKWKAKVGITTFRTNIIHDKGRVYVGSNGIAAHAIADSMDGVWVLNGKSGEVVYHLNPETAGSDDVCGVSIGEQGLYFGSDGHRVYAYHLNGQLRWSAEIIPRFSSAFEGYELPDAQPEVENVVALADYNGDEVEDVVVAAESGDVVLLDGRNGEVIWQTTLTTDTYQRHCIGSPSLLDINGDQKPEIFIGSRQRMKGYASTSGSMNCLNGANGDLIWSTDCGSGVSSSANIYITPEDTAILVSASYSKVFWFTTDGTARITTLTNPSGGIEGLFGSPVLCNGRIYQGTSWWGYSEYSKDNIWVVGKDSSLFLPAGRVSASAVVGKVFRKGEQVLIPTEKGELFIFESDLSNMQRLWLVDPISDTELNDRMVRKGTETSVLLADVDGDRKVELLFTTSDGYLWCYDTKGKWKKGKQSQFRFNNSGTGIIHLDDFGF